MTARPTVRTATICAALLLAVLLCACSPGALAQGSAFVWVESWRHEIGSFALEQVDAAASGPHVAAAAVGSGRVLLYELGDDGPRFLAAIEDVSEGAASVAVAAASGQGVFHVWVGTRAPGLVYVYRLRVADGHFERIARVGFAWEEIVSIVPLDLDGWGEPDMAVLTTAGTVSLFRWGPQGYREVSLGHLGRDVKFLRAGNIVGDEAHELVLARGRDQVVVLRWRLDPEAIRYRGLLAEYLDALSDWNTAAASGVNRGDPPARPAGDGGSGRIENTWENYVWGGHAGVFVGRFGTGAFDQIAIVSTQSLVQLFGVASSPEVVAPLSTPLVWRRPPSELVGTADVDRDGRDEIVERGEHSLAAWRVFPAVEQIRSLATSRNPVRAVHAVPGDAPLYLIVSGEWGFTRLKQESPDYVRVLRWGREVPLSGDVRFRGETLYFNAQDLRTLVGATVRFDAQSGRITGIRGFRFFVGAVGDTEWILDGRSVELDAAAFVEGGRLYVPIALFTLLGAEYEWEPYSRTLILHR